MSASIYSVISSSVDNGSGSLSISLLQPDLSFWGSERLHFGMTLTWVVLKITGLTVQKDFPYLGTTPSSNLILSTLE